MEPNVRQMAKEFDPELDQILEDCGAKEVPATYEEY
jgi:hypothetical protein